MDIVEGAIKAYSELNFNSVSFDQIAVPAKVKRRLVQHYFPDKDVLFETTMKLVRAKFQLLAVEAFTKAKTPEDQFKEYVRSTFHWTATQPTHVRTWLLFYLVCSQAPRFRRTHEELQQMGAERIAALLRSMDPTQNRSEAELRYLAKSVQRLITGGIVEACTERPPDEIQMIQEQVVKACFTVAGFSPTAAAK